LAAQGSTTAARVRRERRAARANRLRLLGAALVVAAGAVVLGFVFAGSNAELAAGTRIAGVDVGGLTPKQARSLLEQRSRQLADVPVTFVAGGRRFQLRPVELGVTANWGRAVAAAERKGEGFAFLRGYRRLAIRLFPREIAPKATAYNAAVGYEVGVLAGKIDRPHRQAHLVRRGLDVGVVSGQTGRFLERDAAARVIVAALAGFSRAPVILPVRFDPPQVTVHDLVGSRVVARRVVSAPVTVILRKQRVQVSRAELASMLVLPRDGTGEIRLGGPAANRYFARLSRTLGKPPVDARFAVSGGRVLVLPSHEGLTLDVPRSAAALLAAAERRLGRSAHAVVTSVAPQRTTADARAMGITGLTSSYETFYGGVPNRIHNVQLVAHLIDGTLIAPGATFSFNAATGERSAAKGFLEAPVIINGELQTGLGGGVCQVSTTVFNAAYEAGLPITARTNHALYISHYPLGRDATVDYPDVDLKFVNDTKRWLLLRTFVGSSSLVVNLYGTPQHRRVETETAPLRVVGRPPVVRTLDKSLKPGEHVVEDYGVPAQATSVRRLVYSADGKLLYDSTWYSRYVAEPKIVLVGPKKKPAKKPSAPAKPEELQPPSPSVH
jgi:vancomycin resistance protein YoaR